MTRIEGLTKSFGGKKIIDGLSYSFEDGRVYILSGASGSGKTTLLSILAGIDRDYEGSVITGSTSFAFQGGNLLPWLDCAENTLLASTEKPRAEAEALLSELGIDDPCMYPSELSGGMKIRVGLARALFRDAGLYLLDEPFAGLDSASISLVSDVIKRKTAGKTVIAVVHDSVDIEGVFEGKRLVIPSSPLTELIEADRRGDSEGNQI
ncbi:MAG: ATP-binding cassette domain-containing protein [Clostridiales bacterium]|nr:ATP-binding cassette domain-containing protein [Clostridiales bacterium]